MPNILYQTVDHSGRNCDVYTPNFDRAACDEAISSAYDTLQQEKTYRTVGWVTTGVGLAATVTGVILLFSSDDPARYDQHTANKAPSEPLTPSFGWGRSEGWVALHGVF
jgi:hypothetical protein